MGYLLSGDTRDRATSIVMDCSIVKDVRVGEANRDIAVLVPRSVEERGTC